jgi:hypothetical protein
LPGEHTHSWAYFQHFSGFGGVLQAISDLGGDTIVFQKVLAE